VESSGADSSTWLPVPRGPQSSPGENITIVNERYKKAPSIVSSEIGEGVVLVPIRQKVGDLDSVYTLNETAARIWALVDGQRSVGDIRDEIVAEFEIAADEAQQTARTITAVIRTLYKYYFPLVWPN